MSLFKGDLFTNTVSNFEQVSDIVGIDTEVKQRLLKPRKSVIVSIPIRMDNNTVKVFDGYRVQHNQTLGPCKGGIRYHPSVNLGEVAGLAMLMSLKNALLHLPLGGSKGGICVDPTKLSESELQALTRRYTTEIHQIIGPETDIPAPDVGTDQQTMAWIMDTFSHRMGFSVPGVVTGKPLEIGGSMGRISATGLGTIYCLAQACKKMQKKIKGLTISIQGFGNVGSYAAISAYESGMKVVAVSDVFGGIYNKNGLNIPELISAYKKSKSLSESIDSIDGEVIDKDEVLSVECDILLPAALDGVIDKNNANDIRASIVLEGANGPVTPDADEILEAKKVTVIPDILANGGGVVVSYFEWVQGVVSYFWTEKEVNERLKTAMEKAFDRVWSFSEENGINLRRAAMGVAAKRLEKAMQLRSIFPR